MESDDKEKNIFILAFDAIYHQMMLDFCKTFGHKWIELKPGAKLNQETGKWGPVDEIHKYCSRCGAFILPNQTNEKD